MGPSLSNTVIAASLVGMRVTAVVLSAPFFSHSAIPARVKAGLVFGITILLFPVWPLKAGVDSRGQWLQWCANEVLVGLVIGLIMNLIFDGVQLAGHIVGTQVGFSLVNIIDPQSSVETPVFSVFHELIAILIFLQMDIHHWVLRAMAASFQFVPVGRILTDGVIAVDMWKTAGAMWVVGIEMSAPVLVATIVVDLTLGFLSKASPQFPAMLFGISLKSVVGLCALSAAIRYWPGLFERYFTVALSTTEHFLRFSR